MRMVVFVSLFMSMNSFALDNQSLDKVRQYFSKDYKRERREFKIKRYSERFFKYVVANEQHSYENLVSMQRDFIKNEGINKVLDREDFEILLNRLGQYHPNGETP